MGSAILNLQNFKNAVAEYLSYMNWPWSWTFPLSPYQGHRQVSVDVVKTGSRCLVSNTFFVLKQEGFCLLSKYSENILWHTNLKRVFTLLFSLKDHKRSVDLVNLKFVNIICCQFAFIWHLKHLHLHKTNLFVMTKQSK